MTDDFNAPSPQAIAAKNRSAPMKVTGRLKHALDLMVWKGARRAEAAEGAGMTDHSLRAALKKPHVKAAYLAELEVLRTSERARNIHALVDVRDGKDHSNPMARVNAAKALEGLDDALPAGFADLRHPPGVTIRIINPAPQPPVIDVSASQRLPNPAPALPSSRPHLPQVSENADYVFRKPRV
jgi:hypothetical protein